MNFIVQVGLYAHHNSNTKKFSDIVRGQCWSWSYDVAISSQVVTSIMVQDLIYFLFLLTLTLSCLF